VIVILLFGALAYVGLIPWPVVFFLLVFFAFALATAKWPALERAVEWLPGVVSRFFLKFYAILIGLIPGLGAFVLSRNISVLWIQVVFFVVTAAVVALAFWRFSTKMRRWRVFEWLDGGGVLGIPLGGWAVPIVLAWNTLWISIALFSSLTFALFERGGITLTTPARVDPVGAGQIADLYVWHFLEMIPLVQATETLGWSTPLVHDSFFVGVLLLSFKIFVILPLIGLFKTYWDYRTRDSDQSSP
jgi:hypothetical protein